MYSNITNSSIAMESELTSISSVENSAKYLVDFTNNHENYTVLVPENYEYLDNYDYDMGNLTSSEPWMIYLKNPLEVKSPHKFVPLFIPIIVTYALTSIFGFIGNSVMMTSILKGRGLNSATR